MILRKPKSITLLACPRKQMGYRCHATYPEGCEECGRKVHSIVYYDEATTLSDEALAELSKITEGVKHD